jgi:membrane-bound metal-dependent hydrolase YbcI (DUF457 family)
VPSPIGHALGGIAAGSTCAPRLSLRTAAILAAIAIAPDLDLLLGAHSAQSHSVGAAVLCGLIGVIATRSVRWGAAAALAYASHPLLDWLGTDGTPPVGVMALWPFSDGYFESKAHWFMGISRRYWLSGFVEHNMRAILIEVATLGPWAGLSWVAKRRAASRVSRTRAELKPQSLRSPAGEAKVVDPR